MDEREDIVEVRRERFVIVVASFPGSPQVLNVACREIENLRGAWERG